MTSRSYGSFPPDNIVGANILNNEAKLEVGFSHLGASDRFAAALSS